MSRIILKGYILVPEQDLQIVKRELVNHKKLTLQEQGCISFSVTENSDNPLRFDVFEEFVDKAAFEQHQARVKSSYWGKVTLNVERHYEILDVSA
ncbi:putative quinol monooxygenase [Vibrio parahaemolyticus]|uniref:putative quinol monooxygenase n=1 Tax=Vibrio parahaemolyticus TaxID=670 RepID=UPI0004719BB9|nr:antibiotic biosynthesis monooxygenase [Vibrio parahaemolyticus]HCE4761481.1 antibiotic biosynthesis monooxygenase [Vibrio parahaemolyticus]HCG8344398.1 antibiotic biosynthesis monooxygenase [Vibrio parahaemolyticus]HCH1655610.1 antibiotic biosynthesis monooxygenase [Vibrio parahaemolyticus]HCH3204685.1 antibiotic biosynthesis monooxygenase [Vibrio parahaemolyticus]HCH3912568.1 antibiotic biosynthesis monooxygenase [Vibrio parahaemolyticus]